MTISKFRGAIEEMAVGIARDLTDGLLAVMRGMSLDELLEETRGAGNVRKVKEISGTSVVVTKSARSKGGRLGRRSATEIGEVVQQIVALLGKHPKGLRAEQIRAELGLQAKELPRPIADGLRMKAFRKTGQKRATVYSIRGGVSAGKVAKASGKSKGKATRGTSKSKSKRGAKASKTAKATGKAKTSKATGKAKGSKASKSTKTSRAKEKVVGKVASKAAMNGLAVQA